MMVVHVFVHVIAGREADFERVSLENARCSRQEPGVAQFDVLRQQDDPARFVLVEAYRTPEDALKHKETPHYARWRDAVADWMAEPRRSLKLTPLPSGGGEGAA